MKKELFSPSWWEYSRFLKEKHQFNANILAAIDSWNYDSIDNNPLIWLDEFRSLIWKIVGTPNMDTRWWEINDAGNVKSIESLYHEIKSWETKLVRRWDSFVRVVRVVWAIIKFWFADWRVFRLKEEKQIFNRSKKE